MISRIFGMSDSKKRELLDQAEEYRRKWTDDGWRSAISLYSQVIDADPNNEEALIGRADCYYKLNKFNEAMSDCNKYVSLYPDKDTGYSYRYLCYYQLGMLEEAFQDINQALKLNPTHSIYQTRQKSLQRELQAKQQNVNQKKIESLTLSNSNSQTDPSKQIIVPNLPQQPTLTKEAPQPFVNRATNQGSGAEHNIHGNTLNSIEAPRSGEIVNHSMIMPSQPDTKSPSKSVPDVLLQSFEIPQNEVALGNFLAEGAFGKVFKGTWRHNEVAVKQLNGQLSMEALDELRFEASVMAQLRSPNIIQFYGICTQQAPFYLVMEFASKGSLFSLLRNKEEISLSQKISFGLDIAKGLAFLHASRIVHRDLKSPNVLIDKHLQAKLTDFGLARVKTETSTSSTLTSKVGAAGTVAWMAPELFKRKAVFTEKSDMYSFGMVCWELLTRKIPFSDANGNQTVIMGWINQGEKEEIPSDAPPKLAELIRLCWETDPSKRPTADNAVHILQQL